MKKPKKKDPLTMLIELEKQNYQTHLTTDLTTHKTMNSQAASTEVNNSIRPQAKGGSAQCHCSTIVQRGNYLGREYLRVGGVVVALEGDICRDDNTVDRVWTETTLDEAAARITAAMKVDEQFGGPNDLGQTPRTHDHE